MVEGVGEIKLWALMVSGGPMMIPIMVCSVFALTLILERALFFISVNDDVAVFKRKVFLLVRENKIKEAVRCCNESRSPSAKILKAGLMRFSSSKEDIKESMADAGLFEIPRLESRLTVLATIANAAPLFGLLGTVMGMAAMFQTIQVRAAGMNPIIPADLAGGIWQSLITAAAGLMVAVPTFIAYHFFVYRVDRHVQEMEKAAAELLQHVRHVIEKGQRSSEEES